MRLLYSVLFYCAIPFIVARLYWRGRKNPAYRARIAERFGYYGGVRAGRDSVLWIHAVSVGETESAVPLIRRLRERCPAMPILVTTTTPTGSARVSAVFREDVEHCYLPYDLPDSVWRLLRHFRPRLAVILETEIWPNLFAACHMAGTPLFIVNARMSLRSLHGYQWVRPLVADALRRVAGIAAQTEEDARRFTSLGVDPQKITVAGNLKFDVEMPSGLVDQGSADRQVLFPDRPVLIAASTHDGEEELVLGVLAGLRRQLPNILLILVPRHPERFGAVAALCRRHGYAVVRRSDGRACAVGDAVFLLDSIGELKRFYAASDIAFVGGSLVPVGGHNVLEPAMVGCPVLFGPHIHNFESICSALVDAGAGLQVNESTLGQQLADLFSNAELCKTMGLRGKSFVVANRGALDRVMAILAPYLRGKPGRAGAVATRSSRPSANGAGRPTKNP